MNEVQNIQLSLQEDTPPNLIPIDWRTRVVSLYQILVPLSLQIQELTEPEMHFFGYLLEQERLASWLVQAVKTIEKVSCYFLSKPRILAAFISEETANALVKRYHPNDKPFILRLGDKDPSKIILHFVSKVRHA